VKPSEELLLAARYRTHAEELRVIAESDRDRTSSRMLLRIAVDYDRMASILEEIDKTNRSILKR
jgi:hypothetical protein